MPAIPSILVGRIWPAATPVTAQYLQGGTVLSAVSASNVAAAGGPTPAGEAEFGGPVTIKFMGTRFCQVVTSGSLVVKRLNPVSDAWEIVLSTTFNAAFQAVWGLYPYQASNGVAGIFCPFWSSATVLSVASTTDGVSWTVASAGAPSPSIFGGINYTGRGHMHRNKLVVSYGGVSTLPLVWAIIDPVGLTVSAMTTVSDGAVYDNDAHCLPTYTTFNNRLFMLFTRNVTTVQAQLYELTGGAWGSNVSLGGNTKASTGIGGVLGAGGHALVPVGSTMLVAIVKTDRNDGDSAFTTTGSRAFDLTPSGSTFTVVERTNPMIPASLRPGGAGGTDSQRWTQFVDDVSVPGTPTQHFFLQADDLTGTFSYFPYVNSTTLMIESSGPSVEYLLPHATWGGGSYVASAQDMDVWVTGLTPLLGGTRVSYQGSGLIAAASLRQPVNLATAAVLPACTYANGTLGVGATLTANAVGILPVDGVATSFIGQLVLVKDQVSPEHNGRYQVTTVGTAGVAFVLTRTTDFDQAAEVFTGAFLQVSAGTANAGTTWQVSSTGATPVVMGTSAISFSQVTPAGMLWRANCRLATAAALPDCTAAGAGVGKTLTANAVGILTVDGVATGLNDRLVVNSQANGVDNGLYKVTTEGTGGAAFVLTRTTDFDTVGSGEVIAGAYAYVTEGDTLADLFYELTTAGSGLVVDTTALTFTSRLPASLALWYSTLENTNMTQAALYGIATGAASLRNVNQVDRVSPDGITPSTADWRSGAGGDGLANGQAVTYFPRVSV